jgi:hypothetical protein
VFLTTSCLSRCATRRKKSRIKYCTFLCERCCRWPT